MSKVTGILVLMWIGMLCAGIGSAQENVNGSPVVMGTLKSAGPQSSVDFTTSGATAPIKTGLLAARPSSCAPGQMYFATDAAAGQNLYMCTATGVWSLGTGGSGGGAGGQANIYSNLFSGASEYQQAENCLKGIVVPYTVLAAAAVSQQVAVAMAPGLWSPRSVQLEETVPFASGSGQITTLAASVGTVSNPLYYLTPLTLMQATPNFKADNTGGQPAQLTSHILYLQVSVANNNPGNLGNGTTSNLTSGQLTIRVCGVTLQ